MTLKGSTKEFPLDTLLRLLHDTKKTGELTIRGAAGEGALGLAEGRVVTAMFSGETKPIPALGAVFKIGEAEFEFLPWDDAPPANLEGELDENLKRAEEYAKWLADVREVIPHDGIRFRLSEKAADQGTVSFTPDRWRVVMAINTQPDVTTLASNLHIDRDEALTTLAGLVRDGVIETIDAPEPPPPPPPAAPAREWGTASAQTSSPSEPERGSSSGSPAAFTPESRAASAADERDWSAGLLKETDAPQDAAPAPAVEAPAWAAPQAAPAPAPASTPEWTAPTDSSWGTAAPTPPPAEAAPAAPAAPSEWGPTVREVVEQAQPERPAAPTEWGPAPAAEPPPPSVLDAIPQDWAPAQQTHSEPEKDPLASLSGIFDAPAKPAAEGWGGAAAADTWKPAAAATPAPEPALGDWGPPPGARQDPPPAQLERPAAQAPAPAPAAESDDEEDLRITAIRTPRAPDAQPMPQPKAAAAPNEWAPPPSMGETTAPPKKKGLGLGALFRPKDAAPEPAARTAQSERAASTRPGLLAAFCNGLLTEFNSGRYGKGHVDDRIAGLLMRVDEQADPIDRPLPVVDDRLDVQALERVSMPEQQAVPYLALLVSTIYSDAEKVFGRDKAKRGYRAAQQGVFGTDTSALNGPDIAGKLPKV